MPADDYQQTFSRIDAPYLEFVRGLRSCRDVAKVRPDVRKIQLERNCANVDRLPALTKLERVHCELREDWLSYLCQLPNLERVEFQLPSRDDIPSLKGLKHLRSLVLLCNKHQTHLNFLRGMHWLRSLCVSEALGVEQFNPLSTLKGLQELYVDGSLHRRHKVRTLAPLAKLTDLRFAVLLVGSAQNSRPLRHLLPLKKLEYLYLASSYKDPDELDQLIDELPRLSKIEFNGGLVWPPKTRRK